MIARIGIGMGALAALFLAMAGPAAADDKVVKVSSQARPWDTRINKKYQFGSDGRSPAVAFGINLNVNRTLTVTATGSTTTARGGPPFGPNGQLDYITGALPGNSGAYFPSRYIESDNPVCLNQLVGAFVDADGVIIGEPFAIGAQATLDVPKSAVALSMGLNDDIFSDNSGELIVTISYRTPTVTAEDPTQ